MKESIIAVLRKGKTRQRLGTISVKRKDNIPCNLILSLPDHQRKAEFSQKLHRIWSLQLTIHCKNFFYLFVLCVWCVDEKLMQLKINHKLIELKHF